MKTNNIKTFAKKARLMLLDGVTSRLKYWGFDEDGSCSLNLEATAGGYSFRGRVFNDPSVPAKWNKLKNRLKDKQAVEDVVEQAAYTWFNRLMAIKILEVNGYVPKQLEYANGTRTPMVVQNAKRGQHELQLPAFIELLNEHIRENREEEAFGLLLIRLCTNNKLLYDVFGKIDDYTEILLPQNLLQKDGLMDLLNADLIAEEDYKEVELIGWLYQFYISDKKDKVFADFKKNKKARAEDIPAATQIFTPKWIVKYMVENTVGKLYLDYEPSSAIKAEMKYLVENESDQKTQPIISDITELTLLDPAAGSGHILVTGFDLLFRMYKEEGYASKQAVEHILKHNLWGLDIDERAVQLARFAVLLKAAQYDEGILDKAIIPHIYSFPEEAHFSTDELHTYIGAEGLDYVAELKDALSLLNQGKNIGSALKFGLDEDAINYIKNRYYQLFEKERTASLSFDERAIWYRLKPFLDVLLVMTRKYTSVVANPPYMGQKNMNEDLKRYINKIYPVTKSDLCTVFIEVLPAFSAQQGKYGIIVPPSWMFLSSFEKLRQDIVKKQKIDSLLHLSRGIFGADFGSSSFVITNEYKKEATGVYFRLVERTFQEFFQGHLEQLFLKAKNEPTFKYDFKLYSKDNPNIFHSENGLKLFYPNIPQSNFLKIPGSPIAYWATEIVVKLFERNKKIDDFYETRIGLVTGDNNYYIKLWHEIDFSNLFIGCYSTERSKESKLKWYPQVKGGDDKKWYGNHDSVINWANDGQELKTRIHSSGKRLLAHNFNSDYQLSREGVCWTKISSGSFSVRLQDRGFIFNDASASAFPKESYSNKYLLALLNSTVCFGILRTINPTLNILPGNISKIPFIETCSEDIEILSERNIIYSKKDWDSRETSWDFQTTPILNEAESLKQAYNKWFQEVSDDFFQLHANEEELNRIFIDIYGLQEELTPDVPLKDITILQDEMEPDGLKQLEPVFREHGKDAIELPIRKEEVLSQFVSYCVGLMMGRYRLDKPGLNIAHPNPTDEETASYHHNGHTIEIDEDAIVPLMGKDGAFSDDALLRLKHIILALWGEETLIENLNFLQDCLGASPHKWLTEKFWAYHTRMYKKKPIYWLFTSNPKQPHKAAFRVLTYMHRMNRFTVQQIQRNYLHPHQEHIGREIEKLKENEETLSKQEVKKLETLQKWEVECRNYNEVLKDPANRQIEFDLDDGVSVNYAKFEGAVAKI